MSDCTIDETGMDEIAQLVEFSEARAYESLLGQASPELREAYGFGTKRLGSAVAVFAQSVKNTLNVNRVIGLGVNEPATRDMVDQIAELYASHGSSYGVEVSPAAQPAELTQWLRARRVRRVMNTAIHFRRAEPIVANKGHISVLRADFSDRELVAEICCNVFRMDDRVRALIAGTAEIAEWRQWLAYDGSEPIAAALSFVKDGVGWLGWDATTPEHRGKGAQAALIAHRVNEAVGVGCRYVTAETAVNTDAMVDPSHRNYRRSGFSLAYERATYVAVRSAALARGDGVATGAA